MMALMPPAARRTSLARGTRRPVSLRPRLVWRACAVVSGAALLLALPTAASAKTIVGTPGSDQLVGSSPTGDVIVGGGGTDTLTGGPGNDVIYGVRSNNVIDGGPGDNYIEGGTGDDQITAGNGRNTVYGSTGADLITLGDGNNYVDPGAANDRVTLGNGDNVVNAGLGGLILHAGRGSNTVYYRSGPDEITLGGGVNAVYLATVGQFAKIDCGGNPASVLYVNASVDPTLAIVRSAQTEGKVTGCPTIKVFEGLGLPVKRVAGKLRPFRLVGTAGGDLLYGGHGGGSIRGKGGDNILHADRVSTTGGAFARSRRTRITAGNGNNEIFGGRGTNRIIVGKGSNFIRGGTLNNWITVGSGDNVIRLHGRGTNHVTILGGASYVETFVAGDIVPVVRCLRGARGIVVYGVVRPKTNCKTVVAARTALGKRLQVQGIEHVGDSGPVVTQPILPGEHGIGVARPPIGV